MGLGLSGSGAYLDRAGPVAVGLTFMRRGLSGSGAYLDGAGPVWLSDAQVDHAGDGAAHRQPLHEAHVVDEDPHVRAAQHQ